MNQAGHFCDRLAKFGLVLIIAGAGIAAKPVAHGIVGRVNTIQAGAIWKKWKQTNGKTIDAGVSPRPGEPELWLWVRSCRISTLVLSESDAEALHRFPAARHINSGGVVVYAHRDTHFRRLSRIQIGDRIKIEKVTGSVMSYQVRSTEILLPEQVNAALDAAANRESLYLLTCYPFRFIGAAPQRFLVTAIKCEE